MALRVLLVENNPDHAFIEERALRRGFGARDVEVTCVTSLADVEAQIASNRPDVAMVDLYLNFPVTGWDVADALILAGVPFVMVSSRANPDAAVHGHPVLPKDPDVMTAWAFRWAAENHPLPEAAP